MRKDFQSRLKKNESKSSKNKENNKNDLSVFKIVMKKNKLTKI